MALQQVEMPTISTTSYTSSAVDTRSFFDAPAVSGSLTYTGTDQRELLGNSIQRRVFQPPPSVVAEVDRSARLAQEKNVSTIRIVKVFIADPNENLPLDKRLMYSGAEQLTDLTDQELFFEVPIAELLKAHNVMRLATVDKKQTEKFGRDVFLEPVRIRDLKMVVVAVATF